MSRELVFNEKTEHDFEVIEKHPCSTLLKEMGDDTPFIRITTGKDCYHKNYMEYLAICWYSHYGVVVSPHVIWYTILTELASHIKGNSHHYRKLFTDSDEKEDISVLTSDPVELPMELIHEQLVKRVPIDTDLFLPEFTTSTKSSKLASLAAFMDAVSPYYSYSMYLCEISKIRIDGNIDDWVKIRTSLNHILEHLDMAGNYIFEVKEIIALIIDSYDTANPDFWQNIFSLKRCGSGSQVEVEGWYKKLFINPDVHPGYVRNFPSQVSKINYKNLSTKKDYAMHHGLFGSSLNSELFLEPDFDYTIQEVDQKETKSNHIIKS